MADCHLFFEIILTECIRADDRKTEGFIKKSVVCNDQFTTGINGNGRLDGIFKIIGEVICSQKYLN